MSICPLISINMCIYNIKCLGIFMEMVFISLGIFMEMEMVIISLWIFIEMEMVIISLWIFI